MNFPFMQNTKSKAILGIEFFDEIEMLLSCIDLFDAGVEHRINYIALGVPSESLGIAGNLFFPFKS